MNIIFIIFLYCIVNSLFLLHYSINRNYEILIPESKAYHHINYFDLGSNNGDSILWLFEANPSLCNLINSNVNFLKRVTQDCDSYINCPVVVSNRTGFMDFKKLQVL